MECEGIYSTYERVPNKRALSWVGGWMDRWREELTVRQMGIGLRMLKQ